MAVPVVLSCEEWYKNYSNIFGFRNGGRIEMKKLLACTAIIGAVAGTVAYMNKNGLPILGNLTMNIPVKLPIDGWDIFTKGIEIAEGCTK